MSRQNNTTVWLALGMFCVLITCAAVFYGTIAGDHKQITVNRNVEEYEHE